MTEQVTGPVESVNVESGTGKNPPHKPFTKYLVKVRGVEATGWEHPGVEVGQMVDMYYDTVQNGQWTNINLVSVMQSNGQVVGSPGAAIPTADTNAPPIESYAEAHAQGFHIGENAPPAPTPVPLDPTRVSIERQVAAKIAMQYFTDLKLNTEEFEMLADRVYAWISSPPKT